MTVEQRIKRLLTDSQVIFNDKDLSAESKLEDDLGMDSLDIIELAIDLEDEFGIDIGDEPTWTTFDDVVNSVKSKEQIR